ncbi:MAG: ketopantoate reductase family protein [Gemmatimonadaceae bacterium]
MRIAIIGLGGVGGYYGGLLARDGHEVFAYARGAQLDAVKAHGLEIRSAAGGWTAQMTASNDAAELASSFTPNDFAIVAVKAYSLPEVAPALRAFAQKEATLLPLLNGVDAAERLTALGVERDRILGGLTYLSAAKVAPGVIERRSPFHRIQVGEFSGRKSERAQRITAAFVKAGVEAKVADDITLALWQKFVFLSTISTACGLVRAPIGGVRESERGRSLVEEALREVLAVADARGVRFGGDEYERVMGLINSLPAEMRPSLLLDVESGARTEVEVLSGTIARFGDEAGIDTPVHDRALASFRQ